MLGEWWTPPDSVRQRLLELLQLERRPENDHPNTLRGIAYRMLIGNDSAVARSFAHTAARTDFENAINHWVHQYRAKHPENDKLPDTLSVDSIWLDENAR